MSASDAHSGACCPDDSEGKEASELIDVRREIEAGLADSEAGRTVSNRVEVLEEIRLAEEQIARGEGIEHEDAKRQVLARLCR